MTYTDDELLEMSDEQLAMAFKEAKADVMSPEVGTEQEALEQPIVDSDDNTSSDDEEVDTFDEESDDTVDDTVEVDDTSTTDDDQPTDEEEVTESKEQPTRKHKYRANGQEFEFTDEEIFERFGQVFGQAMDYTKKMQQIKPWRKTIDAFEQAKLSQDDINLAIDVLKGDKDAIATVLRRTGVDALELDTDNVNYQPKDYGRNDTELTIKEIVEEIQQDKEYPITYDILERQWDARSKAEFAENPELIRQLHIDVKSGIFGRIAPIANKLKVYDGAAKSDLDYYKLAARQFFADEAKNEAQLAAQRNRDAKIAQEQAVRQKIAQVKTDEQKREAVKTASLKRKAAAPTAKTAGQTKVVDYLDASDEAFEEWYKRIQDSQ